MAPCTIAARTVLLAGGRPAEIALCATPLQWTTAFSPGSEDDDVGPSASTPSAARVAASQMRTFMASPLPLRLLQSGQAILVRKGTSVKRSTGRGRRGGALGRRRRKATWLHRLAMGGAGLEP